MAPIETCCRPASAEDSARLFTVIDVNTSLYLLRVSARQLREQKGEGGAEGEQFTAIFIFNRIIETRD